MRLRRADSENDHELDIEDINAQGDSYFDLFDQENSRYLRRLREIRQRFGEHQPSLETETQEHRQNIRTILSSFGVDIQDRRSIKPSREEKKAIRNWVEYWSLYNPQSSCHSDPELDERRHKWKLKQQKEVEQIIFLESWLRNNGVPIR